MDTWLEVLQAEVAASSLAVVADKLGLSRTTISQVCNQKYPGDLARVQRLVEGNLMGHKVTCPILGEIPVHQCLAHQRRRADEVGTRPMDIKLWKACHSGCPRRRRGTLRRTHHRRPHGSGSPAAAAGVGAAA